MAKLKCPHKRICKNCKEQFSDAVRAAYKLGLQDGEHRLRRTIELLKTTNGKLWEELCRLDREDPVVGVVVPELMLTRIIKALRKQSRNYHLAKKVQRLLKK